MGPERGQIILNRRVFPLGIQIGEDVGIGRLVADGEGLRQGPVMVDGAAGGDDGAQRVLQAEAVVGLLADLDVGDETEHGSAPIGAAPGVSVVEALIA